MNLSLLRLTEPGRAVLASPRTTTNIFTHSHRVCTPARCRGLLLVLGRSWSRETPGEEEEVEEEEELYTRPTQSPVPSLLEVPGPQALYPPPPLTSCLEVSPAPDIPDTRANTRDNLLNNTSSNSQDSQGELGARPPSPLLSTPG